MENRYTNEFLRELRALPLERKVGLTLSRICEFYTKFDGKVYVSFSGGKDSTVLLHLVRGMFPDVPAVFADTGLEFPGVREISKNTENCLMIHPDMSFRKVIEVHGYPVVSKSVSHIVHMYRESMRKRNTPPRWYVERLREVSEGKDEKSPLHYFDIKKASTLVEAPFKISHKCCDELKKKPMKKYEKETGRHAYIATMTEESILRRTVWRRFGCNIMTGNRPHSMPMSFWTEQDVLEYIMLKKLPLAREYGEIVINDKGKLTTTGEKRTGCMFCLFGIEHEKEPNKIQRLSDTNPKVYRYIIENMGFGEVMDWIGIPYRKFNAANVIIEDKENEGKSEN